jgi:glutaminyl-peptide cyclotransferase
VVFVAALAAACGRITTATPTTAAVDRAESTLLAADGIVTYEPVVVATYPHDADAFTQGLEFVDGLLLESTGRYGSSSLRLVDPLTGDVIVNTAVEESLFAEGATVVGDEIWQLTWRSEQALVYSVDDLVEQRRVSYSGEGWGLCFDDDPPGRLIMSDGSDRLTFRDPASFEAQGSVAVADDDGPITQLNELECVDGLVWANIWKSDRVVAIEPDTGDVVGQVDLAPLVPAGLGDQEAVTNGVAYDAATGRYWVTGKLWPVIYEIELRPVG